MLFCPNEAPDHLSGQRLVWNLLQRALRHEHGVAWFHYPVFAADDPLRRRPDALVLSLSSGLWMLSARGDRLETFDPATAAAALARLGSQAQALCERLAREPVFAGVAFPIGTRLALPFVPTARWRQSEFAADPELASGILTFDELQPRALRRHLAEHGDSAAVAAPGRWTELQEALSGAMPEREPRPAPEGTPVHSPLHWIDLVTTAPRWLDEVQERVANEIPEGPQRIRGVAGSGKTLLLARRAAIMHAVHPDWDLALVYAHPGSAEPLRRRVETFYRDLTGTAPDYTRLRIWHAWGSEAAPGFYGEASHRWTGRTLTQADAQRQLGWRPAATRGLAWACEQLEGDLGEEAPEPFLDAILIDEGQDLPPSAYRLARLALRPPRRLYWTHDDAQGIENLVIPRAVEVFGLDELGRPRVDLSGQYPSGIPKARNLRRSYRSPGSVLTYAQAMVMGLARRGGPLQAVFHRDEWSALGLRAVGDFSDRGQREKSPIRIERDASASGHPFDHRRRKWAAPDEEAVVEPDLLEAVEVQQEQNALATLIEHLRADFDAGLTPDDLLVIVPSQAQPSPEKLRIALNHVGIKTFIATARGPFRQPGCVTICDVEFVSGQEAWKVYVCGLQRVTAESVVDPDDEILRRNQAYLALTRTRLGCVAIGEPGPFMTELARLLSQGPGVTFPALAPAKLRRDLSYWILVGGKGREPPRELS